MFQLAADCNLAEVKELQEQSQAQRVAVEPVNDDEVDVDKCDKIVVDDDVKESGKETVEDSTEANLSNEKVENFKE